MRSLNWHILVTVFTLSQVSPIIFLENCKYSIDLYEKYSNILWSSNDSHTVHIQAVYSLSSNKSLIPGHIYAYSSQIVALIPFFIQCKYPDHIASKLYLPFAQCSATITNFLTKKNYESTRTYLNLKTILSMTNVPLLYTGEYDLLLSNCSFHLNGNTYQLKPNDLFKFHIEYESSINDNITSCTKCNQRTSICHDKKCQCRSGTIPYKLHQNKEYCIDTTSNCSYDLQRCLKPEPIRIIYHDSNKYIIILIISTSALLIVFLFLLWYLFHHSFKEKFESGGYPYSPKSIFTINRHERTPSTISTTDSIKLNDYNCIDQHILANEYVSTFYEEYPKIISDKHNTDLVFILA